MLQAFLHLRLSEFLVLDGKGVNGGKEKDLRGAESFLPVFLEAQHNGIICLMNGVRYLSISLFGSERSMWQRHIQGPRFR